MMGDDVIYMKMNFYWQDVFQIVGKQIVLLIRASAAQSDSRRNP